MQLDEKRKQTVDNLWKEIAPWASPEQVALLSEKKEQILGLLSAAESHVLPLRFDMQTGKKAQTYSKIAEQLRITGTAIERTVIKALRRLKTASTQKLLKAYAGTYGDTCRVIDSHKPGAAPIVVTHDRPVKIDDLNFSVRASNAIRNAGARSIDELLQKTPYDLLRVQNAGKSVLTEIMGLLAHHGLYLKGTLPSIPSKEQHDFIFPSSIAAHAYISQNTPQWCWLFLKKKPRSTIVTGAVAYVDNSTAPRKLQIRYIDGSTETEITKKAEEYIEQNLFPDFRETDEANK
jgi:hypothetical protein